MADKEKVYCVNNFWDMTILEGVAQCNSENFFFESTYDGTDGDWMGSTYNLTLLDKKIFKISLENWEYWKQYLEDYYKGIKIIPHSLDYAKKRETMSMEEIALEINKENNVMSLTEGKYTIKSAEKYYQNKTIIKNYLKNSKPIYRAKGTFYGDINCIKDTKVIWENVTKI